MTIVIAIGFVLGLIWLLWWMVNAPDYSESSQEREAQLSLDYHRINGQYQVRYNDGKLSQPFLYHTARFYADHFGGEVILRSRSTR